MEEEQQIEQKESVKLTKNSKGVYQWELKILREKTDTDAIWLERLDVLNKILELKYGNKQESKDGSD